MAQTQVIYTNFSLAITAGTPQDLVTPTSGKKVRVHAYRFSPSAAAGLLLKDGGAADALLLRAPVCAINTPDGQTLPGAGKLLAAVDGKLRIDATANATLVGWVATSEE